MEKDVKKPELPLGNGELILVVDDEASIREITKETLEASGYRVLTGNDGTEAIALYATHAQNIALVITDMMMPYMSG
jgi:CheY-like chemotaxis protein